MENPLFALRDRHAPLPFDQVRPEHFLPALEAALADARERLAEIRACQDPADFANTIEALEACDEWADRVSSVFHHLLSVHGVPALQELAQQIPPLLSAFASDRNLDPRLFQRVRELYESRERLDLSTEQQTVLENHYLGFTRNGALLPAEQQAALRGIDEALSTRAPLFARHVLEFTQAYALWIDDEALVASLPATDRAAAREAAEKDGRPQAWKFTLDFPSFTPFMTHCPDAERRRELWTVYQRRCLGGEHDNQGLIREILTLRHRRARLLGYDTHAHYVLQRRMAGSPDAVMRFLQEMAPRVMPAARRDLEDLRQLKERETGETELFPWDYAYYHERLKRQRYELDEEQLRPYFAFDTALDAVFDLCATLFDLKFVLSHAYPVYQPDVKTYEVSDRVSGAPVGVLYLDAFHRPTKRNGAWMVNLLGQGLWGGEVRRPHVGIACNLMPPAPGRPCLLRFDEVRTLFHEFGHALHELLSQCTYRSVSGVNVFWDFVELPSQILENWLTEPEALRRYARHHLSGEALPPELITRIREAANYQKGYQAARQLAFGLLDMAWHSTPPEALGEDLIAFERRATEALQLFRPVDGTAMSPAFQHIFSGGYSAGYYSYKWAEVLEADAFGVFLEEGIFNPDTGRRFRDCILARGGSEAPMNLFRAFRGREPDPEALLRRDGLLGD